MTPREVWNETVLRPLVVQAFEVRETPYLVDACQAIVVAHERRPLWLAEYLAEREASA